MHLPTLPDRIRDADDCFVNLVRDVENMLVRNHALNCVIVEERLIRMATQDKRKLPCEVEAILQPRVEPLTCERAREVSGVPD
jgi:hypothetical protein